MASPVGSAPRAPEELLAVARRRGTELRRRRRVMTTGLTGLAAAVVAVGVYLAVPGSGGQQLRTVPPAHAGAGTSVTSTVPAPYASSTTLGDSGTPTTVFGSGGAATTVVTGPPVCLTSQLALSVGAASGAAGGTYYELTLTNRSSSTCILSGYPGVSFLDSDGAQIGEPAQRMGNETIATVHLAPGGSAYVTIRVTDPGVWPCPPTQSTRIRVFPPGQTAPLLAPLSAPVCSAGHPSGQVGPVTATSVSS